MGTVDPTVNASAPLQTLDNPAIKSEPNGEICFRGKRYRVIYCKNDGSPDQVLTDQKVIENVIAVLKNAGIEKNDSLSGCEISEKGVAFGGKEVSVAKPDELTAKITSLFKAIKETAALPPPPPSPAIAFEEVRKAQKEKKLDFDPKVSMPPIYNKSNSCYVDSTLYLLLTVKGKLAPIVKQLAESTSPDRFVRMLHEFFTSVEKGSQAETQQKVDELYAHLQTSGYDFKGGGYKQQDAAAFLNFVLNKIGYIMVYEQSSIKIKSNGVTLPANDVPESGRIIPLPLKGTSNLQDAIDQAFIDDIEYRVQEGDKKVKLEAEKKTQFKLESGELPPEFIFLQLGRFEVGNKTAQKTQDSIDLNGKKGDLRFNLSHAYSRHARSQLQESDFDYEIVGIVNHGGTTDGGHYVSKVKHEESNKWFYCNDIGAQVQEVADQKKPFDDSDFKEAYIVALKRVKKL